MASCRLIIDASISKMQNAGVLDKGLAVKNMDAFNAEQSRVRDEIRKLYSSSFADPIGKVVDGVLHRSDAALGRERRLKKKGAQMYAGVTHKPFMATGSVKVAMRPDDISSLFKKGKKKTYLNVEGADGHYSRQYSVDEILKMKDVNPGFVHFVKDIINLTNRDLLNAYLPGFMVPMNEGLEIGRNLEKRMVTRSQKSSMKNVMEEQVGQFGSEALNTINQQVEGVLKSTGTQYAVTAERNAAIGVAGSASVAHIAMDFVNMGTIFLTQESINENMAKIYVHEKVHVMTNGFLKDQDFFIKIAELYNIAVDHANDGVKGRYGMTDIYEFLSEGMTDPEFQQFLASIPYKSTKTLLQRIIDVIARQIENAIGVKINDTVLEELITLTTVKMSEAIASKAKLYNIDDNDYDILNDINFNGKYEGKAPLADVKKWAKRFNVTFDQDKGVFYLDNILQTRLDKAGISAAADFRVGDFYYQYKFKGANLEQIFDYWDISDTVQHPLISFYNDKHDIDGNIDALKEMNRRRVETPSEETHNKYHIATVPHFRATSYLGFSADSSSPLLQNANRIGNVADELAKRVFTEGFERAQYTYEKVNEFVKKEHWGHVKLDDPNMKESDFDANFRNAVSEESYYALMESLEAMKENLMKNHGVVEFIPDLVVWDNKTRVAGEIDILAKHKDGSYTVIDMKTRRKGVDEYDGIQEDEYNTKTKHTRQTSLYSIMLRQLGFKVNDPMIIMGQPVYGTEDIDNQTFIDIIEGEKLILIPLKLEEDLFDYNLDGRYNTDIRNLIESKRLEYEDWFRNQTFIADQLEQTSNTEEREAQVTKLQTELENIKFKLQEYRNLLKKGNNRGAMPEGLSNVEAKIVEQLKKNIEDTAIIEQLLIIEDFFIFGEKQLKILASDLERDSADDREAQRNAYFQIQNYMGVYKTAEELNVSLEELRQQGHITQKEFDRVKRTFNEFSQLNTDLKTRLKIKIKDIAISELSNSYLGSKFEIDMKNDFQREGEEKFKDLKGTAKEDAIREFINMKRRDPAVLKKLEEKYSDELQALTKEVHYDMSNSSYMFLSDTSVNNTHVQLMHNMIAQSKQQFTTEANESLQELASLEQELALSKKEVEELIVVGTDGGSYLQGKYKIEFMDKIRALQQDIRDAEFLYEKDPKLSKIKADQARVKLAKFKKENTTWDMENLRNIPLDKWLNKGLDKLSENQMKALKYFSEKTIESHRITGNGKSLVRTVGIKDVAFLQLPGIKVTKFGAAARGDLGKFYRKAWDETFTQEIDDQEMGFEASDIEEKTYQTYTTLDGKQSYKVPVFFRGNPKEMQNRDLWTVFALESQNVIRYKIDSDLASRGTVLLDMVNESKFYKTAGVTREKVTSLFRAKGSTEAVTIEGDKSVTSKMLLKMLKNNVYSMTQEYAGKIPGTEIDIHKAAQLVSSYTAFASMSFKLLSAGNNWVTGNVSAALEAAGGEFYDKGNLTSAKAFYARNIMGILGDIGKPVKSNIVNQLIAAYDAQSEGSILNNEFEKDNKLKQLLDPGMTLGGYQMGEHEIHATVMLSIMDSVKILDRKGRWLTRDGKTTTNKKEAMSLLDTYSIKDGALDQKVEKGIWYTEHDTVNPLGGGGEASIRVLIKDRITRTQGAFDKATQAELNRQWYGKLFVQFKKHIIPQSLNRFRGLGGIFKETDKLTDAEKYYNYKAKTEEYGYYTSFLRHTIGVLRAEKWNVLAWKKASSDNWKKMTKHERSNVTKTIAEISYLVFVAAMAGFVAAAAEEDDDNPHLWTAAYLFKRQVGDAGLQYSNPEELWRLTDSPMAAMKNIDHLINSVSQLLDPTAEYVSGINAGRNKSLTKMQRLVLLDRLNQFQDGYNKRLYTGIDKY